MVRVSRTRKLLVAGIGVIAIGLTATAVHALRDDADPDPPRTRNPDCNLHSRADEALTLPGCQVIASDTAAKADPTAFWGRIDCAAEDRHSRRERGGDSAPRGDGKPQGNRAFRRMRVLDGDDVSGERCELGLNDSEEGPTVFFEEGDRRITFASIRLPPASDLSDPNWRVAMQMKQAQPYNNADPASIFELQERAGSWILISDWHDLWTAPARAGEWTRFAFDVTYSRDPEGGRVNVYADLNGDGDAGDSGERSGTIRAATLREETDGEQTAVDPGDSIPSHLRAGIYQNPIFRCPAPSGCWVDVDNVQVLSTGD
jgi:Polysaccharide lyase